MTSRSLTIADISEDVCAHVTTQQYGDRKFIDGVRLLDLALMRDESGSFAELGRLSADGSLVSIPDFYVKQISHSVLQPGAVKAFHLHYSQEDVWFVSPDDRLLVGLIDVRAGSSTERQSLRITLGAGRAQLLYIPRGVAHGCANFSANPTGLTYLLNNGFDPDDPDEHRLPANFLGQDFWTMVQE